MKLKYTFLVDSSLRHILLFCNMITHWIATWCWLVSLKWDCNECFKRSDRLQMIKPDTYNLRSGVIIITIIFASLLPWREREKNNAWYIHLTSHQPPPNLHNLTSAWPVMLLANQRLPHGNQILVGIMSLLPKSKLGKRKFLSTCGWRFLKKNLNVFFYLYLTATNNKEFTSSLTSFCGESSEKKLSWSIKFHKLKSVV